MTLDAAEFIRRFLLHVPPDGFHRIRHYGFLANGARGDSLGSGNHEADRAHLGVAFPQFSCLLPHLGFGSI
jgi:hypothetical protein